MRTDFSLAYHSFILSKYESAQGGADRDGRAEAHTGPPHSEEDGGAEEDHGASASGIADQSEEADAPATADEETKEPVRTPTQNLELASARFWQRLGVYGGGSVELRSALLEKVLQIVGPDLHDALAALHGTSPAKMLAGLETALLRLIPPISLLNVLGGLLKQRPALLKHIAADSELLLIICTYLTGGESPGSGASTQPTEEAVEHSQSTARATGFDEQDGSSEALPIPAIDIPEKDEEDEGSVSEGDAPGKLTTSGQTVLKAPEAAEKTDMATPLGPVAEHDGVPPLHDSEHEGHAIGRSEAELDAAEALLSMSSAHPGSQRR